MLTQAMMEHVLCGDFIDEGASARIYKCEGYPGYIIKQQKRSARHISHPPILQQRIQEWARNATQQDNFTHLRVPWCQHVGSSPKSSMYVMELIDVSEPVDLTLRIPEIFAKELIRFYFLAACSGYYPYDYEIYKQPDNTYALVDFDKFGLLLNKSFIQFPFKRTISLQEAGFWAPPGLSAIHNTEIPFDDLTKDLRGDKGLASIPELPPNLAAELEDLEVCLHLPSNDEEKRQLQESFDKNLQRLIISPKPPRARK
jgi:hypothetical protein